MPDSRSTPPESNARGPHANAGRPSDGRDSARRRQGQDRNNSGQGQASRGRGRRDQDREPQSRRGGRPRGHARPFKPFTPEQLAERAAAIPVIEFPDLPVSARRDEIARAIRDHQVVIVSGETGSGKTTQLPKICMQLGRGVAGMIGHTQPRRIAAVHRRHPLDRQPALGGHAADRGPALRGAVEIDHVADHAADPFTIPSGVQLRPEALVARTRALFARIVAGSA